MKQYFKDIRTANNYLFIALGFAFPISIAVANILIALITLLWIIERDFQRKFQEIKKNKLAIALFIFIGLHIFGLLWSSSVASGWRQTQLYYALILFPVFLTTIDAKYVERAIFAFIIAMTISEIASYALYFGLWKGLVPYEHYAAAFIGHVVYTPMLAITVFLLLNRLLYSNDTIWKKRLYAFFIATMSFNVFIGGGRAGQIVFIILLFMFVLFYFWEKKTKVLLLFITIPFMVGVIYLNNDSFRERTNMSINTLQTGTTTGGLGERIIFARNSIEMIANNIFFGVGTGAFTQEYIKINKKNSPDSRVTGQPHNQYLFIMAQFGMLGLIVLLNIFYAIFQFSLKNRSDNMGRFRFLFIIFFLIIMLSDIYLYAFATQMLFVYFSVILFKKFSSNPFGIDNEDLEVAGT